MRFLISSSFTDSLTALDPQNQALVKQSAFDFQLSPQNPGFQLHRITKSKEKNFWSFRANRDVRIIIYKDEATFILCYADHHDAAYAWAERRRLVTYNGLCHDLVARLEANSNRPFDHVVADEVQDFGAAELKLLRALVPRGRDDLFLCGDAGQRIYKAATSFLANGIDIRGRSTILRLNYRTTEQIRRYADALLPQKIDNGDGDTEERQTVSLLNGLSPQQQVYPSEDQEVAGVVGYLKSAFSDGFSPADAAIFARTNALLESRAVKVAEHLGVAHYLLADDRPVASDRLALGTMHRAKGLEFKIVVVLGCDADQLPLGHVLRRLSSDADRKEFIDKERHLFYVACTRARERLLLTSTGPSGSLLGRLG